MESRRRDANDGEHLPVDPQRLPDDIPALAESAPPVVVTEHDDAPASPHTIVIGIQQTSELRREAEDREIRTRNQRALTTFGHALVGDVRTKVAVRGDAGEDGLNALQVPKHRVAEDRVAGAGLTARYRPAARSGRHEVDESLRLWHVQRPQQGLIEDRENRDVRADAKRHRQHRNRRHDGRLEERPKGKSQFMHW